MKFFVSLIIVFISSVANAQLSQEQKDFFLTLFPNATPELVAQKAILQPVNKDSKANKKFIKKQEGKIYQYIGTPYQRGVLEGDTVLTYNGQPFYSLNQKAYMAPVVSEKVAKVKQPKTPEQIAQRQQTTKQMVDLAGQVIPQIIYATSRRNSGLAIGGGLVRIGN